MVIIETLDRKVWNLEKKIIEIVAEYHNAGRVTISFNIEGPCLRSNGFYDVLDTLCEAMGYDKANFTILTANLEEHHPHYKVQTQDPTRWFYLTSGAADSYGYTIDMYRNKNVTNNRFALLVNRPNWNRLCLLSHLRFGTTHQSLLTCNGTVDQNAYNAISLDDVNLYCPNELDNIQRFLQLTPKLLPNAFLDKGTFSTNVTALTHYRDFFIEVVCETYTSGFTFFPTEKTIRPILGLTPFIVFGPQGYLSNLRSRYGFKTFSAWWDESYDDTQNYERVQKMYSLIDHIDSLSDTELTAMYNDMSEVLEYNHNRLNEINGK
jgi:hypothetical protein